MTGRYLCQAALEGRKEKSEMKFCIIQLLGCVLAANRSHNHKFQLKKERAAAASLSRAIVASCKQWRPLKWCGSACYYPPYYLSIPEMWGTHTILLEIRASLCQELYSGILALQWNIDDANLGGGRKFRSRQHLNTSPKGLHPPKATWPIFSQPIVEKGGPKCSFCATKHHLCSWF